MGQPPAGPLLRRTGPGEGRRGPLRCVVCQLCEFICPPRAIRIVPGEIPAGDRFAKVEKYPEELTST